MPAVVSRSAGDKRRRLAGALAGDELLVVPGVFEMISARVADRLGFAALYLTGYGVAASHLGVPDAGLASYADVLERVRAVAGGTDTPLICDADTGFGGLLNVRHTVRGFEAAGCAAVQIEDQESPKRCGLTAGCRVVPADAMVRKIQVALDAREDPELLLIARTDARGPLGLDAALDRGARYAEAGADVVFVQGIRTEAELGTAAERIRKPILVNIAGREGLGSLDPVRLRAAGARIAIHPGLGMLAATAAISSAYESLRSDGSLRGLDVPLFDRDAMHRLMGFEDVWAFEARWDADR